MGSDPGIHSLQDGSLMDYDADDILALRKWEDKGGAAEPEQS